DWRKCEARINTFSPQVTEIDGLDIHFLHARSPHENAMPLIMTHGWPGSIVEFLDVIPLLTDPVAHGGKAQDAFHVIAPSLPGYGFSAKPKETGWNGQRIAEAWIELMQRLGYSRWVAQGGDWGSVITTLIGAIAPEGLAGVHTNRPMYRPRPKDSDEAGEDYRKMWALDSEYKANDWGYMQLQKSRPQTLGYGLVDSPVAQAAWIYEKMWKWTDNNGLPEDALSQDQILDNITLYWLSATGGSSARLYWEAAGTIANSDKTVDVPSGVSIFPAELSYVPRDWAARVLTDIVYWNTVDRGGHFAAWEQPELFAHEVRKCFALMR
ncbi:MAG: epoxide hydrolase, partial [Sphingomonadaceae bacterium]|nr:epoxide hydrolase [Sphingomonadaceae bacterium]